MSERNDVPPLSKEREFLLGRIDFLQRENERPEQLVDNFAPGRQPQQRIVGYLLEQPDFVVVSQDDEPAWHQIRDAVELSRDNWEDATKNLCYESGVMRTHREPHRRAAAAISLDFTQLVSLRYSTRAFIGTRIMDQAEQKAGEAVAGGHLDVKRPDITERLSILKPAHLELESILFGVTTNAVRILGMQAVRAP